MKEEERFEHHLEDILKKHIECNSKLLSLIKEERQHIVHNNLKELEKTGQEKLLLREAIAALESERLAIMPSLCKKYGLPAETVRLEDLITVVPDSYRATYTRMRGTLKLVLGHIKDAHECNYRLIQQSLSFHERSFMLLYKLTRESLGYGEKGDVTHKEKPLFERVG